MQNTSITETNSHDLTRLPGDLRVIFDNFLTQLEPSVTELRLALEAKDWKTLRARIHRLKGSAAMLGYVDLTAKLGEMEESIDPSKDNDAEKLSDGIKTLPSLTRLDWDIVEDYIYIFSLN